MVTRVTRRPTGLRSKYVMGKRWMWRKIARAHVVHGLLADALHDADLNVLREEIEDQDAEENDADPFHSAPGMRLR